MDFWQRTHQVFKRHQDLNDNVTPEIEYVFSTHISEGRPVLSISVEAVVQEPPQSLGRVRAEFLHRWSQEATSNHEQDLKGLKKL